MSVRAQLLAWLDTLLDESASDAQMRTAVHAWYTWGVGATALPSALLQLATGEALSPLSAAACFLEPRRTGQFLRGVNAAIAHALSQPDAPAVLHVAEIGCGPLAPLSLPFAAKYAGRVAITLADAHPEALAHARALADKLGVLGAVRACIAGDACDYRFAADDRPHVLVIECLNNGLRREPQVQLIRHLAPQLTAGGVLIPELIEVRAALCTGTSMVRELAPVATLTRDGFRLASAPVAVPAHGADSYLALCTRIRVWREHCLSDHDSTITQPLPVALATRAAQSIAFAYSSGVRTGFTITPCTP